NGGIKFHAEYSGTLTPSGGTFMGNPTWHSPRGLNGSRTCTAAVLGLARANQSQPQQTLPDQNPSPPEVELLHQRLGETVVRRPYHKERPPRWRPFYCAIANVRFWHKADIPTRSINVHFWG